MVALDTERDLRAARVADLAGELAARLDDGDACPVCGSAEHPAKAVLGADHVSAEQVEQAEADRADAERLLHAAAERCSVLEERAGALRARVGDGTAHDATERCDRARSAFAQAQAAQTDVARLEPALDAFDLQTRAREAERGTAVARLAGERATLEVALLDLDAAEAEVVTGRGDHPTVAARHSELLERVAVLGHGARRSSRSRKPRRTRLGRRQDELVAGLDAHGFDSADEARAAAVDAAVLAELRARRHRLRHPARPGDRRAGRAGDRGARRRRRGRPRCGDGRGSLRATGGGAGRRRGAGRRGALSSAVVAGDAVVASATASPTRSGRAGPVSRLADLTGGGGRRQRHGTCRWPRSS